MAVSKRGKAEPIRVGMVLEDESGLPKHRIRVMVLSEGWAMVRRPRGNPFTLRIDEVAEWRKTFGEVAK